MKKHLFVVAHPDDEVLGAGAFIYDAIRRGDQGGRDRPEQLRHHQVSG